MRRVVVFGESLAGRPWLTSMSSSASANEEGDKATAAAKKTMS